MSLAIDRIIIQSSLVIHKADLVQEVATFVLIIMAYHQINSFAIKLAILVVLMITMAILVVLTKKLVKPPLLFILQN